MQKQKLKKFKKINSETTLLLEKLNKKNLE